MCNGKVIGEKEWVWRDTAVRGPWRCRPKTKGFVSGHRFSGAEVYSKSDAPLGAGLLCATVYPITVVCSGRIL